jgi:hypothetical protein
MPLVRKIYGSKNLWSKHLGLIVMGALCGGPDRPGSLNDTAAIPGYCIFT